jgi:hypothetical protein
MDRLVNRQLVTLGEKEGDYEKTNNDNGNLAGMPDRRWR